jgi:probable DNA repair protein
MNTGTGLPIIEKSALFGRLERGHAAGLTVLTPNRRLAAALAREFDSHQSARGLASWESADVLPFAAFVERLYEDALYSELADRLPVLLSAAQERVLWEKVITAGEEGKALLSVPSAAALACEAWELAHAWKLMPRLQGFPMNDDARAFADWARRYEGITRREHNTDRARLPETVTAHLAHPAIRKPNTLVAYGFDIVTAQEREFLAALGAAGAELLACGPDERPSSARRVALASERDEMHAAARWARARLEADPGARIGIVGPDLSKSRRAVRRIFAQTMEPARPLPGGGKRSLPFNISLGERLASYPLVAAALLALELARGEVEFLRASRFIRSPFIAGAGSEFACRAQLDAELRKVCGAKTNLAGLRRAIAKLSSPDERYGVPACSILSRRLAELAKFAGENFSGIKRASEWGRAISDLLELIGFPGERALDSSEYQTLKKFHEAIAGFGSLDRVAARMRFSDACAHLERMLAETLFQPETPEVPIQVLGVLESAGLEFDHLWVMGLTDEAWPIPARSNPFIPVALQRLAGVPESSAAAALELDRRITQGWLKAAGEVVFSHPLREEDRDLVPSPLIREVYESKLEELALPEYLSLRDAVRGARREERVPDARAPALPENAASAGGTSVFRDQAACPFRAFSVHRLGARGLEAPAPGLDSRERGTLMHAMLAKVWAELKSKARLDVATDRDLEALLGAAADAAIKRLRGFRPDAVQGKFADLEKSRLVKLGRAWLDKERERAPFEVVAIEKKHAASFGGVTVNAKLDRMDRLKGGAHAILDYKSGRVSIGGWLGPRPEEPQLPLYAVARKDEVAAVAFACVKAGEMGFRGIARAAGLLPGVGTLAEQRLKAAKDYASWSALLEGWRRELEALGEGFAAGDARVDPKEKLNLETCRYCEVKPMCRIYERYGAPLGMDEGRSEEAE